MPQVFNDCWVAIIDFHHQRGPEVEHWIGPPSDDTPDWPLLPFLALADGAHSSTEDFSYFTLLYKPALDAAQTSLFGISCTRQLDSRELKSRGPEVTRSTVQKAVVVIMESPGFFFGYLKQQLSAVTQAWFQQKDFTDLEIIRRFQESLKANMLGEAENDQYVGLSLRELVYEFKYQTLVLFKCMLLQPKMLFFSEKCERLCLTQFSLLSLIPGLLQNLQDCADPKLTTYEERLQKPTSVRTSDRKSLLRFMGLPLQIFGKGSLFGPYTPLQQLDILADEGTKSYIVGSTNSLLLQQRDRYSDILVNLDERTVNITSSSLRQALALSAADRRWIDHLVTSVVDSWDEADPSRPKTMGFVGSEEYIRLQFEEYLLAMVSSIKYELFLEKHQGSELNVFLPDVDGNPAAEFNSEWVDYWKRTENFRLFQKCTDSEIFDLVPPRHVMAGGLSVEDIQRRISQQVQDLHIDERARAGREAVSKTLSSAFANVRGNIERYREQREAQRKVQEAMQKEQDEKDALEARKHPKLDIAAAANSGASTAPASPAAETPSRASAYLSSWGQWAAEKKKRFQTTSPPPEGAEEELKSPTLSEKARPGFFSRWSKSSLELGREEGRRSESRSVDLVREKVWENIVVEKEDGGRETIVVKEVGIAEPVKGEKGKDVEKVPERNEGLGLGLGLEKTEAPVDEVPRQDQERKSLDGSDAGKDEAPPAAKPPVLDVAHESQAFSEPADTDSLATVCDLPTPAALPKDDEVIKESPESSEVPSPEVPVFVELDPEAEVEAKKEEEKVVKEDAPTPAPATVPDPTTTESAPTPAPEPEKKDADPKPEPEKKEAPIKPAKPEPKPAPKDPAPKESNPPKRKPLPVSTSETAPKSPPGTNKVTSPTPKPKVSSALAARRAMFEQKK